MGKKVPVSRLFKKIEKYCEDNLYIFTGKTHWVLEYELIPKLIKRGIDIKVLCYSDDINSESAKQLRDWGISVKSYPYIDLEIKGLIVDGRFCSLYKEHSMVIYKDTEIVNCLKVLFLNIFGPNN